MGSVGAGYGSGSQTGSDFFGSPQSMSIDTMMHGSDMSASSNLPPYQAATSAFPGSGPGYGGAFDPALVNQSALHNGHMQPHRDSMSSLPDDPSAAFGRPHRLSIGSNGQLINQGRHNSYGGSDTTSPGGQRRPGSIGENSMAQNSNETVELQNGGGEDNKAPDSATNPLPPWSELKTKAGKERKRLPLACIACRRKKIRCSGEKPACKHCLRSRIPCVYKVTTRKAAPRTDYMAMLDKRLKRMEDRVIKIIPKEEQGLVSQTGRAVVKPPLPPVPPKSSGSSKKRVADAAFDEELDDWANAKAPEAKTDLPDGVAKEPLKKQSSEEHSLMHEGADKLPSKELQEHLAEVFFDFVYCQSYPLLHKPSFMRKLAQGTVPPVLTLAVCAISARFSNHPQLRTEPAFLRGEEWAAPAREIALRRYDTPNLTVLITYLILGLHEFGTCQGGRSWMFGGMGQRMAYALQLHKDLPQGPKGKDPSEEDEMSFTDREIRRRTMWSCFLMDRFISSGTDRPHFVGEQYIRAQLPIKDSYFAMEISGPTEDIEGNVPNPVEDGSGQIANAKENMGLMAYLIRLVDIWGRLVNYLNLGGQEKDHHPMWTEASTYSEIKRALSLWNESLPETMRYTPDNLQNHASEKLANQFIFLHIVHQQVILFMNQFALPLAGAGPMTPTGMPPDFVSDAARAALDAANQISALVNEGRDHHVVAPFAGYAAFLSSTVHVHGAFSHNPALEQSSKQNLAWNVKYLTKMKKYWGMFHFVTDNLKELYKRHAQAAKSGAKSKDGEQSIFQYGDWFDRYPHGVSGTDYEEPNADIKKEPGADVLGQKSDLQSVEEFFQKLSPPSRSNTNQQPATTQRKMAKKRHSKTESKQSNVSNSQQQQQLQQQTDGTSGLERQFSHDEMLAAQGYPNNMANLQHQSSAFPPGFQAPHNPLLLNQQQPQMLSHFDRQMVLNSYAGTATSSSHFTQTPDVTDPLLDHTTSMNDFGFSGALSNGVNMNGGLWDDPSTGWFMPFNLDPPTIGEDGNWFTGNLDWSGFGGGFGGLEGGLAPTGLTGLTPGGELDGGGREGDDLGNM